MRGGTGGWGGGAEFQVTFSQPRSGREDDDPAAEPDGKGKEWWGGGGEGGRSGEVARRDALPSPDVSLPFVICRQLCTAFDFQMRNTQCNVTAK